MKRDYIGKSFKPITNFYCYNCHGYGHKVVDCQKPKFDINNGNSRIFSNTVPIGNEIERSQSRTNDGKRPNCERKQIVCYKCNNPRHIARNYRALENQNGTNQRINAIVQLCNNFGHTTRFCKMDRRNFNRTLITKRTIT